jgi:predicted lipase
MRFAPYILTSDENLTFTSAIYFSRKWPEQKKIKCSFGSEVTDCSDFDNYEIVHKFSQNTYISLEGTNVRLF